MTALTFRDADGQRAAAAADLQWLDTLRLWSPATHDTIVTGEVETAVILLSGTFDLAAGGNAWPARGARRTPFEGRPMAVYLPPKSEFRASGGDGELLLIGARQPAGRPVAEGREALSQSPLLPLAGSGKSFDPATGEWLPAEAFPTSPESLPPRRMQRLTAGDVAVERVFVVDYKAATLTVDEFVLQPGQTLGLDAVPERPAHTELFVFVRTEGSAALGCGTAVAGDAAFALATPDARSDFAVTADAGRAYVVFAYAGK